jgi:hypothetical protein
MSVIRSVAAYWYTVPIKKAAEVEENEAIL